MPPPPAARVAAPQARRAATNLDPDYILQTVVYIQAAFRRFLVEEPAQLLGIRPTAPPPPIAVGLWRCKRLLRPERIDVQSEAMAVAVVICGREQGLTLGPIVKAYDMYAPNLSPGHPVLEMLTERFNEVIVDAEEDLMRHVRAAFLPSEGRKVIAQVKEYWGAPERPPGGGEPLFPKLEDAMQRLRRNAEDKLTSELPHCKTQAGLDAMSEAVELELGDTHTAVRSRMRAARGNYRDYLDLTAHTQFGWPPVGALSHLASAGRWFASEMGKEHPVVEDFVAAVKRLRGGQEKAAVEELTPLLRALTEVRDKLSTDPPPPRLLAESYEEDLQQRHIEAMTALEPRRQEIGTESADVLRLAKRIMLPGPFLQRMVAEAEEAAVVLRRPMPPACPGVSAEEGEERLAASVKLLQLLKQIEEVGGNSAATPLRSEFKAELAHARPWATLLVVGEDEEDEDGWHQPPDFAAVDQPLAPRPVTPPPPKPVTPPRPETPEPEPDVKCKMRLHGVTIEEAQQNSEYILLEKLALIVAKECGVPREWITHIALAPPAPKEPEADAQAVEQAEGGAEDGDDLEQAAALVDQGVAF